MVIIMAGLLLVVFMTSCGKKEEPKTEPAVQEPTEVMTDTTEIMDTTQVMDSTMMEKPAGATEGK